MTYLIEDTFAAELESGLSRQCFVLDETGATAYVLSDRFSVFRRRYELWRADGTLIGTVRRGALLGLLGGYKFICDGEGVTAKVKAGREGESYTFSNGWKVEDAAGGVRIYDEEGEVARAGRDKKHIKLDTGSELSLLVLLALAVAIRWD